MKKTILGLAAVAFVAGSVLSGCGSSSSKVENAQDKVQDAKNNVVDANQALDKAIEDSIAQFKKVSEEQLNAHEKSIAEFKVRIAHEKKENRAKYEKKLAELEQKNTDMKKTLADYKEEGKEQWQAFKLNFNNQMDEIGKSLKSLWVTGK